MAYIREYPQRMIGTWPSHVTKSPRFPATYCITTTTTTADISSQIFFEGVQERIAAGVKEDEVGYQLAFSKQELRKNIKEYPAKELKKGLEQLYKKVEKHLCEEENLLQVSVNNFYCNWAWR